MADKKPTPIGRGGNLSTRPNPFIQSKARGRAPELRAIATLGIVLDEVLLAGCALMLGHTRDGGALVVTVLDGEDRHRTYCATEQELDEAMLALHNLFGED